MIQGGGFESARAGRFGAFWVADLRALQVAGLRVGSVAGLIGIRSSAATTSAP